MQTVITYGTFDLFHYGHVRILKRCRSLGERLVVGLSTDEFNKIKGKETIIPFSQRKEVLESVRYVDAVFPEDDWGQKREDIEREKASILAMGGDWAGKFDYLRDIVDVVYLPRTQYISTTNLKNIISVFIKEDVFYLKNTLESALSLTNKLANRLSQ